MSSQTDVEAELAKLKAGKAPEAIEAAHDDADGGDIIKAEPEKTADTTGEAP
jgi:hypothetical protein